MPYRPLIAAALLSAAAGSALAVDDKRLDTLTVVVTADETDNLPLAVSHVEAHDQPAPSEQSLQDFLAPAPGLFAQNQDNAAQGLRVSIRGFGTRAAFGIRGIQVLVDGVPMTLPDGQTELDAIDLGLLESAEIVRGPSATLFGNAAGGAILLHTRKPSESPEARLELQGASFDHYRARLEGSGRVGSAHLLGAITASDIDGFREHSQTETQLLNARMTQAVGPGQLNAFVSALDITSQDPGGLTAAQVDQNRRGAASGNRQFDAGETIEQQRVALNWSGPLGYWGVHATGYAGQRDFANRLPFTDGGQVSFDRNFAGMGATVSRRFELGGLAHRFSAGFDAQLQQDDRRRFDNNDGARGAATLAQDEEAAGAGVFVRDSIALAPAWETSIGLRYDTLSLEVDDRFLADGDDSGSRDIDDVSADISLSHWLGNRMIYGRLASSFETPTINELANPAGGGFNPDLGSTEALNREIGIKGAWNQLRYQMAVYRVTVDDELLPFELPGQPGRSFFRNAGETEREGIEIAGEYDINSIWRLDASASYARNEFDGGSLDGNELPGIPRQTAWLSLTRRQGGWQNALIASHTGRMYADDSNNTEVDSYQLLHWQSAWQPAGSAWSVQAAIDNLLDKDYNDSVRINAFGGRHFEPAAGRTYRLGLKVRM